ncbi:hypothetical protein IGJ67_003074, partial [Enterococcus sp. MSG4989]
MVDLLYANALGLDIYRDPNNPV